MKDFETHALSKIENLLCEWLLVGKSVVDGRRAKRVELSLG